MSFNDMIAQVRANNNSLVKSRVDLSIRKSSYRLRAVTTKSGTPWSKSDHYNDVDVLNYELSQCNSIPEITDCLIRNSKYGPTEHEFIMELDGQILFHKDDGYGGYYKVWISGAESSNNNGQYRLEGTYTESGIPFCMRDILGTDPDAINMMIAQCTSLDEVRTILQNECPYLHNVYLLTELDGVATFVDEDYRGHKYKIKVTTNN